MKRWIWIPVAVLAVLAVAGIVGELARDDGGPAPIPAAPTINTDQAYESHPRTVFTYFFYWYEADTGAHLDQNSGLPVQLPPEPKPSWRSQDWFEQQLRDMSDAGIDVALPVYWGDTEPWSVEALPILAAAKSKLDAEGSAPDIGLFFDTTILDGRDLTLEADRAYFYDEIRGFFDRIPRNQWASLDGRPVIWLYFSFFVRAFDQSSFDYLYDRFEADYDVRPYIVREVSWDFASRDGIVDENRPIATEANYKWGAALEGYFERGSVAAVGPGFDEREIPGRGGAHRPREDGNWYYQNFGKAIASGKRLLVIETWNEIHEASTICETVEHGRTYIDYTRRLVDEFRKYEPPAEP